jgi:hypothetical protein
MVLIKLLDIQYLSVHVTFLRMELRTSPEIKTYVEQHFVQDVQVTDPGYV